MKNELKVLNEINLKKAEENFVEYLDVSDLTVRLYKDGIKSFVSFLQKENINTPTRLDFKRYRDSLKEVASVNTVNSYLTSVRRFFAYLENIGLYENITKDIRSVKTSNIPKKEILSLESCQKIMNNLSDKREKAIFGLAITTGLRASEITSAKIENIKMYNNEIVLFIKAKKRDDESEYVKLSDEIFEIIKEYLNGRDKGYIFVSESNHNKNGGLEVGSVRRIIKKILKRYGYEGVGFSCHSLRRTSATLMYQNGIDLHNIQQVLHHKSLTTTNRYINQITRDDNKSEKIVSNLLFKGVK